MKGWFLVNDKLSPQDGRDFAVHLLADEPQIAGQITMPILPSGRVHEIVYCDGKAEFDARLTIRSLGWFERTWRMASQVFDIWQSLSAGQRRRCGLTLGKVLVDLSEAYFIGKQFRGITYKQWIAVADSLTETDRQRIYSQIARWKNPPQFQVLLLGVESDAGWFATLASLERQLYRNFSIVRELAPLSGDWLLLLRPGDQLAEHALYWFACAVLKRPDAAIIYADDDELDANGLRCRPRFKPDWSLLHLQGIDYIGLAVLLNVRSVLAAGGLCPENLASNTWSLLLRIAQYADDQVMHIPAVLLHRDAGAEESLPCEIRRARFTIPSPAPLVSIVIPSRDAVELLQQCVESLLTKMTYPRYELVVVDNGSTVPTALAYLDVLAGRPHVRVLRYDRPFNFSAINNFAVEQAQGTVLCLLNNDTEVISPDWLEEMVGHLLQPKVGVVGAKLYFRDGLVQHAGDIVGAGGCANHLHAFIGRDDPGYCNRAMVAQELSAVTAACMVTWRELYERLGGLDERHLPVAFNDVDYCLRVRQAGYRVVWTPHAELYHHESVSRGKIRSLRRQIRAGMEARYMRCTWRKEMKNDPFYNPNFSYFRPDFVLGPAPRVKRPWMEGA